MKTEWIYAQPSQDIAEKISRITGCDKIIAQLLINRGITTPEKAFTFLYPSLESLSSPFALKNMDKAVKRIYQAICSREKILIFGDFDADGITSTTILYDFLSHADAEVTWYIPHRITEGYSLREPHIKMAVKERADLIITVDCGSDSFEAVKAARKEDIDVIITDHHEIKNPFPDAHAIINPKQKGCTSGLDYLAGVGVAFYLIIALRQYMRTKGFWQSIQEPNLLNLCDLVAIGTIADMVPLVNENRILSQNGIDVIRKGKRLGIKALADVSRIDINSIDSEDISFRIAPRINAAGRMSHARICVDLLTARGKNNAYQTASILNELNIKRQETEQGISRDIEQKILKYPDIINQSVIILHDESWNPGVLGIAASKTARQYCRPTVLISTANSPATGSCRSIDGVNIHDALCQCAGLLEHFGGHFMAAGLSIKKENIDIFSLLLEKTISRTIEVKLLKQKIFIDSMINLDDITESFIKAVDDLKPFGTDNPEPMFACKDVKVNSSIIIGKNHRKMTLHHINSGVKTPALIEALQFNIDPVEDLPLYFKKIAFRVRMNRYRQKSCPQIIIEHN